MTGFDPAALRGLELTVLRRLDGVLQGDYRGLLPGHGWEAGEARVYVPGDDVRRIDWNVTARTGEPHVRDTIVDRELETTFVVDLSGSMSFGTADAEKRDLALGITGAIGFLVARGGNRIGALLLDGRARPRWIPPRGGRAHLFAVLGAIQKADRDAGPVDLEASLRQAGRLANRRGLLVIVSDFLDGSAWERPLRQLVTRHEVIAVEVVDPRELELGDSGPLVVVDPETGRRRHLDTGRPAVRRRYAAAAAEQRQDIARRLAGADHLRLRTDANWIDDLIEHVLWRRRRRESARPA